MYVKRCDGRGSSKCSPLHKGGSGGPQRSSSGTCCWWRDWRVGFALAAKRKGFDVVVFEKDLSAVRGEGQYRVQFRFRAMLWLLWKL